MEKTQIKKINIANLKKVQLDYNNSYDSDYPFLSEEMRQELEYLISQEVNIVDFDIKNIFYDLSNCQGDGAMFEGSWQYKYEDILCYCDFIHSGHYNHYNCKNIEISFDENVELGSEEYDNIYEQINNSYISICRELEKFGYSAIEEEDKRNIFFTAFNDWKEINEIELDSEIYDFNYVEKETDGFVCIAESGNTCIDGLYIKDFTILQETTKEIIPAKEIEVKKYKIKI